MEGEREKERERERTLLPFFLAQHLCADCELSFLFFSRPFCGLATGRPKVKRGKKREEGKLLRAKKKGGQREVEKSPFRPGGAGVWLLPSSRSELEVLPER